MDEVKYGVIGVGNIGSSHAEKLFEGHIKNAKLTAICYHNPKLLKPLNEKYGDSVTLFESTDEFYNNSELYDAVVIATPHREHTRLATIGFEHEKHVIIEKPAGVYAKQVRELNEVAEKSGKKFGIMYNQRTNPIYQKVRDIVQSGELGDLKRMIWIVTNWYRPQSYHDSGSWRSTWALEGGGVLINQCPHNLDLWQWMIGMPDKIQAFASYGKYYNIEVEDDVTAYAQYKNGATALFVTSTGETPGTNRLEISGDMGKLVVEDDKLTFWRNRISEREFNKECKDVFGNPECFKCEIPINSTTSGHVGIFQNFTNAILNGEELLAPGIEGINGLQISNAIHLSSWTGDLVELPIDEDLFYEKLEEKIKNSIFKKK